MELQTTKRNSVLNFKKETALVYSSTAVAEWKEELNRVLSQIKANLATCMFIKKAYKETILEFNKRQKSNIGTRSKDEAKKFAFKQKKNAHSCCARWKKGSISAQKNRWF